MMHSILLALVLVTMSMTAAHAAKLPGSVPLTSAFAESLIREKLQGLGQNSNFDVVVDIPRLPMGNQEAAATDIMVEGLRFEEATGRFKAVLVGMIGMTPRFHLPLEGRAQLLMSVAVLARPMARGEHISAQDLDWIDLAPSKLPKAGLIDPDQIIGSEARRRLSPGRVLTSRDVGPPRLVRRGQPVRVVYADGELKLTALGTARDDGAFGEPVRVVNPESNLQLQGIATGPSEVTVGDSVTPGAGY